MSAAIDVQPKVYPRCPCEGIVTDLDPDTKALLDALPDDCRRDALKALVAARRPEPPVVVTATWDDGSPRRVACAFCGCGLNAQQASEGCPNGCTCVTMPACHGCGSMVAERSACPLCGQVFCQPCAERPYEFCCDGGAP